MSDDVESAGTVPLGTENNGSLVGRTVGDFAIVRRLGQGGMGEVFLADQLSLKRKVAIKFLKPQLAANDVSLKRFRAEAEAVARLTHGNIVQVYSIGEADGLNYMALEFVDGKNLQDFMAKKGPLSKETAFAIMRPVALALQRASEAGIVHRDIKPANILLSRKGEVKVADFGLSRVFSDENSPALTQSGMTMGTPLYMSPEQVQGLPLDPRSDIYSFGVTCYHMLAGRPPFTGENSFEIAFRHVKDLPARLEAIRPDLPPELTNLVHRMMEKDPDKRPQSGRDISRDLLAISRGSSVTTVEENPFANLTAGPPSSTRISPETVKVDHATLEIPMAMPVDSASSGGRYAWVVAGLLTVLSLGVGARLLTNKPARKELPEEVVARLPVITDEEKSLREKVTAFERPKADEVTEGLKYQMRLGNYYFREGRFDDAFRFFSEINTRPGVPQNYKTLGEIGIAISAAFKDHHVESNKFFQQAKGNSASIYAATIGKEWPKAELIDLQQWILRAIERNASFGVLPGPIAKAREEIRGKLGNVGTGKKMEAKIPGTNLPPNDGKKPPGKEPEPKDGPKPSGEPKTPDPGKVDPKPPE